MDRTPIVILVKERPKMLRAMVESILAVTDPATYRLIFVDNASVDSDCKAYLRQLSETHTVIYNDVNHGLFGFNSGLAQVQESYYILTDPDIKLNSDMPKDWVIKLRTVLDNRRDIGKVGLALNITWSTNYEMIPDINKWEGRYWVQSISLFPAITEPCYVANIDTTIAMYRSCDFNPHSGFKRTTSVTAVRVAGRYTAEHLGWDIDGEYAVEMQFYIKHCDLNLAGTANYLKNTRYKEMC